MKDRVSNQPGRVLLRKDGTVTSERYFMTIDDDPSVAGTPLNKANILTDQTETDLFGEPLDKTPNQAFDYIAKNMLRSPDGKSYKAIFDMDHPYFSKKTGDELSACTIAETKNFLVYGYSNGTIKTFNKTTHALSRTINAPSGFSGWETMISSINRSVGREQSPIISCIYNDVFACYYRTTSSTHVYVMYNADSQYAIGKTLRSDEILIGGNENYCVTVYSYTSSGYQRYQYSIYSVTNFSSTVGDPIYFYEDRSDEGHTYGAPDLGFVILSGTNDLYIGREVYHWGSNFTKTNKVYVIHLGPNPTSEKVTITNQGSTAVWESNYTYTVGEIDFIYLWHDPVSNRLFAVKNRSDIVYIDFSQNKASVFTGGSNIFNTNQYPTRYICHVFDDTMQVVMLKMSGSTYPIIFLNMDNMSRYNLEFTQDGNRDYLPRIILDATIKHTIDDNVELIPCQEYAFATRPLRSNLHSDVVSLYRCSVGTAVQNFALQYEKVTGELLPSGSCSIQSRDTAYSLGSSYTAVEANYIGPLSNKNLMFRIIGFSEV